jgi:hypothetical protein
VTSTLVLTRRDQGARSIGMRVSGGVGGREEVDD